MAHFGPCLSNIVVLSRNLVNNFSVVASQNSYSRGMVEKRDIFSQNDWTVERGDLPSSQQHEF